MGKEQGAPHGEGARTQAQRPKRGGGTWGWKDGGLGRGVVGFKMDVVGAGKVSPCYTADRAEAAMACWGRQEPEPHSHKPSWQCRECQGGWTYSVCPDCR